jgi:hypothetical protein
MIITVQTVGLQWVGPAYQEARQDTYAAAEAGGAGQSGKAATRQPYHRAQTSTAKALMNLGTFAGAVDTVPPLSLSNATGRSRADDRNASDLPTPLGPNGRRRRDAAGEEEGADEGGRAGLRRRERRDRARGDESD